MGFSISTVSTNTASQIFNALSHTRAKLTECSACMCSVTVSQTFQTLTGPPSVRVDAGHISNYLFLTGLNSPRYCMVLGGLRMMGDLPPGRAQNLVQRAYMDIPCWLKKTKTNVKICPLLVNMSNASVSHWLCTGKVGQSLNNCHF